MGIRRAGCSASENNVHKITSTDVDCVAGDSDVDSVAGDTDVAGVAGDSDDCVAGDSDDDHCCR